MEPSYKGGNGGFCRDNYFDGRDQASTFYNVLERRLFSSPRGGQRTRFLQIWRYFHLADNSTAPPAGADGYDKLYRVREFLNIVSTNISREYKLSRDTAIDETMVPHTGRLSFKQCIKNKPTQWGIKLSVLSESQTGYVYKFQVYLGKDGGNPEQHLARRVVKDLTAPIEGNNHHLYMDNLYCDPYLLIERMNCGIFCCGTV